LKLARADRHISKNIDINQTNHSGFSFSAQTMSFSHRIHGRHHGGGGLPYTSSAISQLYTAPLIQKMKQQQQEQQELVVVVSGPAWEPLNDNPALSTWNASSSTTTSSRLGNQLHRRRSHRRMIHRFLEDEQDAGENEAQDEVDNEEEVEQQDPNAEYNYNYVSEYAESHQVIDDAYTRNQSKEDLHNFYAFDSSVAARGQHPLYATTLLFVFALMVAALMSYSVYLFYQQTCYRCVHSKDVSRRKIDDKKAKLRDDDDDDDDDDDEDDDDDDEKHRGTLAEEPVRLSAVEVARNQSLVSSISPLSDPPVNHGRKNDAAHGYAPMADHPRSGVVA
jgi:hypothetical protein